MENIVFEINESLAIIKLNRPDKFNSFIRQMALDFQSCLDECQKPEIRAVLIIGTGKAFSAGQDLKEAMSAPKDGLVRIVEEHYNPIIRKIRSLEKPVIAAVNGVAAGAGANIALACDIILAHEKATFIQAFSKIGLIPDSGGTYTLPRHLGYHKALALMMTGDKLSCQEAKDLGLVYKIFTDEDFQQESQAFAQKLSSMPTYALGKTKMMLQQSMHNTMDEQLDMERDEQLKASLTNDYKEGVEAFVEKRKPNFKGR
jgi:2-(1,2-epoxy-1,2-dihydrophenyl)acetyl-CoA isomerase